jgi:GTP-binding protein HflX
VKERALLVGIHHPQTPFPVEDCLEELALLADTAGVEVVGSVRQNIRRIDAGTFVGRGKVEEIAARVKHNEVQVVIFDDDLSPAQARNIERSVRCKVIDRSALILDIFARRAKTKEAKTQVELAQLQYLLPRLTRQWTHLERQAGGGVFTKGPGETQLETDRRLVGKRIALLKEELAKIELHRRTRRSARADAFKVALVGYTNAGKSTLLNALSDAGVYVEDRLFATLDATSRKVYLDPERSCIVTDTVGFIRKLPHDLVASFRSTLEEVREADVLVHLVDLSNHLFDEQMETVGGVLKEMDIAEKAVVIVFNKVDLVVDQDLLTSVRRRFPDSVFLSATRGIGLDKLREALIRQIEYDIEERQITLPVGDSKTLAAIHHLANVLETHHDNAHITIRFRARREIVRRIFDQRKKQDEMAAFE